MAFKAVNKPITQELVFRLSLDPYLTIPAYPLDNGERTTSSGGSNGGTAGKFGRAKTNI